MKQIDGKAKRVVKYDRMFFWYVPLMALFPIGLGLAASGWNWVAIGCAVFGGLAIGAVLGVLLRDTP